ncbi:MAG TPA: DUF2769 domain-containing protein [Methanoculleus sp.]|nr:DUF2769 domain-containing protein [Methanoculleus sp.]
MTKFKETMEKMKQMSDEERAAAVENLRSMCICPTCPTYNECAKKKDELLFCATGKSFMCIHFEKECLCPGCPVTRELGLNNMYFCTRGSEKAQRYEHTIWGAEMK